MPNLSMTLKLLAPVFLVVSAMHLSLGPAADVLLGATLSAASLSDPVLDSQNRFYGVAFGLYGVLLYLCATDLARFVPVLRCVLVMFFLAGIARLLSIALLGLPSWPVLGLLLIELAGPLGLWFWMSRLELDTDVIRR